MVVNRLRLFWLYLALIAIFSVSITSERAFAAGTLRGWSLEAKYSGQTTLPHEHYHYALLPGATVQDAVLLNNFDTFPHTIMVYGADMLQAEGGGLAPAQVYEQMHGVGAWLTVSQPKITIPPGQEVQDVFTITLPKLAVPGDYEGAMVAEDTTPIKAGGISASTRLALLVEVTVLGSAQPAATLTPLVAHTAGNDTDQFKISVINKGNILLKITGAIVVTESTSNQTQSIAINPAEAYVVPGGTLNLTTVDYTFPKGVFTVQARLMASYTDANNQLVSLALTSNSLNFTFIDWLKLGREVGLFAALLLLLAYLIFKLVRDIRRFRARKHE